MSHAAEQHPPALFASEALVRRVEAAEVRSIESLARSVAAEVWTSALGGGVALYCSEGSPFNKCAGLGFLPLTAAELNTVERAFAARRAPLQVELSQFAAPALTELLIARGYRFLGYELVLARALQQPIDSPLTSVRVRTAGEELRGAWIDVLAAAAVVSDEGEPQAEHSSFDRRTLEHAYRDMASDPSLLRFVATLEDRIVGGASMSLRDGVAQLNGAATLPLARRRGVQSALLRERLGYARASGCDLAVVTTQPGSKSQQNAQRAGFSPLYVRALWLRSAYA